MSDTTQVDAMSAATTDQNQDNDLDQLAGLGDKGKETIRKEREARRIADEQRIAAEKELIALRKADADRKKAEEEAAETKAVEERKFAELAEKRGNDLKAVTGERDALQERVTTYEALIKPIVTERLDALKAASATVAEGFPTDADVLTQLAWLDDPRTKALIAQGTAKVESYTRHVNTPNPHQIDQRPKVTSLVNPRTI